MLLGLSGGDEQPAHTNVPLEKDLLCPSPEGKREHKKKHLVQSPSSYFMGLRCPGCAQISTAFSHAQMVGLCGGCSTVIHQPRGGKARLSEGCPFRRKQHSEHPESRCWEIFPINIFWMTEKNAAWVACILYQDLSPASAFEPTACQCPPSEAADHDSSSWVPATHMGDSLGALGSLLQPGLTLALAGIWGVN
ncbi:uncharacterized protein [Oryctolagus cuniculus]|uniref:uncharacterized protein n=1 Tax=Oryctolagus cuniculus TaxID=9986 RepID=UPI00387A835C